MRQFKALWAKNLTNDPSNFADISSAVSPTSMDQLSPGEILVKVAYSSLNYKDALAVTGKGKILRHLPLIPGIDFSGWVVESSSPDFAPGAPVLMNGCGLGEIRCGGLSEYVRVRAEDLLPLPPNLSLREAMIFGTAGFTAGLALHQLEHNGLTPEKGRVLVTGATGGVGSLSLQILKQRGYHTLAWSRKTQEISWLKQQGAQEVEIVADKDFSTQPLATSEFAGAIDSVGGNYLSYIIPRIDHWGSVASIGLAQSPNLNATVFPFILRGVNLLGISSSNCPRQLRKIIWQRLATDLKPHNLDQLVTAELNLGEVYNHCQKMIAGDTKGRALVVLAPANG